MSAPTKYTIYDLTTRRIIQPGITTVEQQPAEGQGIIIGLMGDPSTQQVNATGDGFDAIARTLAELKVRALAAAAQRRWEIENGGVIFWGDLIATDDRSKLLLSAAAAKAQQDAEFTTKWKLADGTWAELNAAGILAAYAAVFDWVSECFAREEALGDLINSSTTAEELADVAAGIQAFWPDS